MQNILDTQIGNYLKKISFRDILIILIIIVAIFSRLVGLGDRVMSHDEVNHVVPAFDLFSGRGYRHDPVTHGPLQFHLMGLSYFLFGDNDFTSRLPHALFSIAAIAFVMIFFRRYLGNIGSIIAGILFTISPFMLFYGRYARNDIICVFLGIVSIFTFLRYFETKDTKFLYYLTASIALNFTAKETAYIFTAQLLIFVFLLFVYDLFHIKWMNKKSKSKILLFNGLLILISLLTITSSVLLFRNSYIRMLDKSIPFFQIPGMKFSLAEFYNAILPLLQFAIPGSAPLIGLIFVLLIIRKNLKWELLQPLRSFSILILLGTLVLPLLAPFLVRFAGMDPSAYSDPYVVLTDYVFIGVLFFISYIIGSAWDKDNWWKLALVFYGIYTVFYSTFFTNTSGLMTGMVGSLGHWLNQQSVQRGGQPAYYYAFFLLPIYEFLSLFGTLLAFYFGIKRRSFWRTAEVYPGSHNEKASDDISIHEHEFIMYPKQSVVPSPAILIYLIITSVIAYTLAGEKMPWLTLHIVFPLLLTAAWAFDQVLSKFLSGKQGINKNFHLGIFAFLLNSILIVLKLSGNQPPFHSQTQVDLQSTYAFLFLCLIELVLIFYFYCNREKLKSVKILNSLITSFIILLFLITCRTGYKAAFINYDNAKEFLVYAHAARGPKLIMEQVEEISRRTTNGLDIKVAYDNHGLYPFWWYMRHYPNKIVYLENPTRSLEEAPLIIAGQDKYAKLDPIIRDNYYYYEYMRLWWPMQDYWNLNLKKVFSALGNGQMRQALFNIWFDRDYTLYANIKGNQNLTLETWLPSEKTRLYIRQDIAAQMWQYNTDASIQQTVDVDPYEENMISKIPDGFISMSGSIPGELNSPRGIDIASDGTIYVADSLNHRIQVFSPNGLLINVWGSFANILEEEAPGGTFNEPWDVAVADDGSIYVADTFNHRIQKFDETGRFIKMWGTFAQGEDPESFWGPRGIDIDNTGNVFVTDTGNKRVVVFDSDLNYITQFGGGGFEPGEFDEPVGIVVSDVGDVIVADTWNRRIQIFTPDEAGVGYVPKNSFDIDGWYGQGIDNKPYLTTDSDGNIYISDPEGGRILQFDNEGVFIQGYQDINISADLIGSPYGLAITEDGTLWFSDAASDVLSFIKND